MASRGHLCYRSAFLFSLQSYLFTGAPTNYGLYESMKRYWSDQHASLCFSKRRDTTYSCSYSYWSPEDYGGMRYSHVHHLPLLYRKPIGPSSPVNTSVATKSDRICSLRPRQVSSQAPLKATESNQLASCTVKQQTNSPVAAL